MTRLLTILLICLSGLAPSHAEEWQTLRNEAYGFSVEVPDGFEVRDPDVYGWTFADASGVRVLVFAVDLLVNTFEGEASNKVVFAMDNGWGIEQSSMGQERAKFIGVKNGRVLEAYGIWLCMDAAAVINVEYDQARSRVLEPTIKRLVANLKPPEGCELSEP
ncbi:hypothetical protein ASG43_18395 [Aureimonas sp. Leaf454]|uniref:hypothetical protein n=1 Tax=Aureimonas sp. Leaf454 TaxID=1736381 RepID=UPI0006FC4A87|nr:hypothetical protein [Aureimonas sp. Leaf454]KQT53200.1 hypothetical protein ASG43_18395 [Aureimonas sp. Leaf454]